MLVCGRSFMFLMLLCFIELSDSLKNYNHGINIALFEYTPDDVGQNNTRHLAPILIIPVFIENSKTLKLMKKNTMDDEDDIDVGFRQSLTRGMGSKNKLLADFKAKTPITDSENEIDNKTYNINSTENVTKENITIVLDKNSTDAIISTSSEGLYMASNSSKDINSILFTTTAPDTNIPPSTDNRWQNFTVSNNLTFGNESSTKEPDLSTYRGPYSAALYNNRMIDQISITTNSYTNEESPLPSPKDDRWRTFSEKVQSANEFKPLAGLYYDGFLHKPLIMLPGFIPRKYYNLYE